MHYWHITGSGTFVTQWGYNSADLVSSMVYPGGNGGQTGETVSYTYLSRMALDTVSGLAAYVTDTLYNAAGQVELRKLGGTAASPTLKVDTSYFPWDMVNGLGRLKRIISGTPADSDSLQDLRYYSGTDTPQYDANGNLLNIYDYKAGGTQTQTFTYDTLDRLLSAAASGGTGGIYSESYTYNGTTGNLASKGGVSYTYGAQSASCPDGALNKPHGVVTAGSNTYCYDKNGNQVKRTIGGSAYTLSYDAENRLTGVSGAATATFVYDGDGVRVKATAGGVTTAYVGNYFEWTGSTSTMVKYYYAGTTRIAMRTGSGTGTTGLNWLLGDHLGSTSVTADASGNKVAELRYKAWGETRYTSGTTPTKRQYTGQLIEMTTIGLYFYGARFYDPALSRFTSADSIIPGAGEVQAWDRYAYTINNPIRYNDPTGHVCSDPEDPTPTCEKLGTSNLEKITYGKDKDNLKDGGRKAYQYYYRARNNPGWWNNNEVGTLTVEQFLGIFMLYEASGIDATLPWIKDVTGYQLFLPTPDNFGGNAPYCTGELCRNGIFNFMAAYQGYGKYGDSSDLVERFATLSNQPALPKGYSSGTLADAASDIGYDILGNRSDYQTGNPYSVPWHWGNESNESGSPFFVTTVTGTELYRYQ